ncbi:hypothetical protein [Burkholderia ubonensis]|uniref:hypothetical protein n=1 Tax=Burkholderia ubonensis TaxID=101571 RepID=UPI000A424D82|nr:hypothetical protein [Burkholderia ubonensis]
MAITVWGTVDKNGNVMNGSNNFSVANIGPGRYKVTFNNGFTSLPAVVATQNNFGSGDEYNTDGVVVPFVEQDFCQINTGGSDNATLMNRSFSFIAMGN